MSKLTIGLIASAVILIVALLIFGQPLIFGQAAEVNPFESCENIELTASVPAGVDLTGYYFLVTVRGINRQYGEVKLACAVMPTVHKRDK